MHVSFSAGNNLAIKVPSDEFEATVAFYRETLGLPVLRESDRGSVVFDFGGKRLWIDRSPALSQAEIWLEVVCPSTEEAADYLREKGVVRRDDIEVMPRGSSAFWVKGPNGIVHLVSEEEE